ncbi:hypothetical protein PIB30_091937 [Stylosanthes scabra]|uniref:Uncharacterized protein n=1 Tax=Stylosanthes scabra TaxID=79078 RepID=A0ABU6QVT5_9FABA|nr:hypothetical protein [Stylosanthes scabra]
MLSARRILPELILQADEDVFNPIRYQIYNRKWEKFTSRFKPLAISWSRNFMLMLGSRTKQRGSIPLTPQVLPFPSIIAALCADAKIRAIPNDTLLPQEPPIVAEAMVRTREPRVRARQATHPQQPPQQHP